MSAQPLGEGVGTAVEISAAIGFNEQGHSWLRAARPPQAPTESIHANRVRSRPSAMTIAADVVFRGAGRSLLEAGQSPTKFFDLLVAREECADAIRFLAHALPKRVAIWWGCLCLWHVSRPAPAGDVASVLDAAVRWVHEPSEHCRRAAEKAGRVAGIDTPAGCLGLAIFWSGGSMAPAGSPTVAPAPRLTARVLAGGLIMAAARAGKIHQRVLCRREFLALGRELACGRNLWTASMCEAGA